MAEKAIVSPINLDKSSLTTNMVIHVREFFEADCNGCLLKEYCSTKAEKRPTITIEKCLSKDEWKEKLQELNCKPSLREYEWS